MKRKIKRAKLAHHKKVFKVTTISKFILSVIFITFLVGVIYLGVNHQKSTNFQDSTRTTKFDNRQSLITPTKMPPIEISNWKTFENEKFTIKYPDDWRVEITPLIGDRAPGFKPANEDYPLVQVSYLDLDNYVITCKENGLREVKRTINGVEVVECVGTTTGMRNGRETDEIAQWRNLVIFGKSNKFSFNYLYISDNQNNYYEDLFDAFLKSFVIQ